MAKCEHDDCFTCPYSDCICDDDFDFLGERKRKWWRDAYYRNKSQRLAYMKEYRQRPEVKARHNEQQRLRRKKVKENG